MDGFLKALGFESKPEFKDKIPDTLTNDCFKVHDVSCPSSRQKLTRLLPASLVSSTSRLAS